MSTDKKDEEKQQVTIPSFEPPQFQMTAPKGLLAGMLASFAEALFHVVIVALYALLWLVRCGWLLLFGPAAGPWWSYWRAHRKIAVEGGWWRYWWQRRMSPPPGAGSPQLRTMIAGVSEAGFGVNGMISIGTLLFTDNALLAASVFAVVHAIMFVVCAFRPAFFDVLYAKERKRRKASRETNVVQLPPKPPKPRA